MSEHILPAEEPIKFVAPLIQDNPTGWGPCEMPEQFRDMPYQPFSKGDRLGKISDWTMVQDKKYQNKYASQFGAGSSYAYYHDEDESTFHLVDTTRVQKPPYQRGRARGQRGRGARGARTPGGMTTLNKQQRDRKLGKRWGPRGAPMKIRDASVTVRPTWVTIEDMDFPRLAKLSLPGIKEGEDIICCGTLEYYDKAYDRVNVKHEKPLQRIDRVFHTVTTTDDPVIRRLSKTTGTVYATDAILATIMCCTRSNYSWDIVIEKIGDKLFLDKRDNTEFDLLTVNETSVEPPADDNNSINSPRNLALEATFINHNFSQQVLKSGAGEPKYKFLEPNPFVSEEEEGEVASVGYRYRKWNLNNGVVLVARCEHDAVLQNPQGETQFLSIKALNEWDSKIANGVEWRQKLDTQRGAVLANELRNNSCKLAKWTVQEQINIRDQIPKYLNGQAKLLSTRCIIIETEKIAKKTHGALTILKQFGTHECGHKEPIAGSHCILSMIGKRNDKHYIIASQDRDLQEKLRQKPGVPLLYLHNKSPTLEKPSKASYDKVSKLVESNPTFITPVQNEMLKKMKQALGVEEKDETPKVVPKKKKISNPNPLSCKKKKNKSDAKKTAPISDGKVKKRNRKKNKNKLRQQVQASISASQ